MKMKTKHILNYYKYILMFILDKKKMWFRAARDGKRVGNAVRTSGGGREAGHAGSVHATIMGVTPQHGLCTVPFVHLRGTSSEVDRARHRNFGGCGDLRHLDDSAAVRLRAEFSGGEVPAGAEQGDGDRGDSRDGHGAAPGAELAAHGEAGVGARGRRRRAQRIVVVRGGGPVGLCFRRVVLAGVERVLVGSVSESLGVLSPLSCFCCYALVSACKTHPRTCFFFFYHSHHLFKICNINFIITNLMNIWNKRMN